MLGYLLVWAAPAALIVILWNIERLLSDRPHYHLRAPDFDPHSLNFLYGAWTVILWNYFGKKEAELEEIRLRRENICAFCKKHIGEGGLEYSMQLHAFVCGECLPPPAP